MKMRCCRRRTAFWPEFHLRQWVTPSSTRLSLMTPFATQNLHFFGNRGIQLHLKVAGNYPRIPGITLGLGLVHYPLLPVTHRFALLVQSGRSAPPPWLPTTERRTACPSSDGSTRDEDGFCFKDRRACRSPWTTQCGGPTTRELSLPRGQQCYEVSIDGPMQFAFANPLCLPASDRRVTVTRRGRLIRGLPTLRQATCRTLR
jgi:hypothetical protein